MEQRQSGLDSRRTNSLLGTLAPFSTALLIEDDSENTQAEPKNPKL
jgi:hypothetical protein